MRKKKDDITVKAREALKSLWDNESDLKGRTWGKCKKGSSFRGTNLTFGYVGSKGPELVTVFEEDEGKLAIWEFSFCNDTELGAKIKDILQKAGLI